MKITGTIAPYGATIIVTLSAEPKYLATLVNRLVNYGAVHTVDEDYKDGIDHTVRLTAYKENFHKGVCAMIAAVLAARIGAKAKGHAGGFKKLLVANVAQFMSTLEPQSGAFETQTKRHAGGVFSTGGDVHGKSWSNLEE